MAEIHVQTKRRSSNAWIWVVLFLVIAAAVVYYLMNRSKQAGNTASPANTTSSVNPAKAFHLKALHKLPPNAAAYIG